MRFYRIEYSDAFAREALPLLQKHDAEVSAFKDIPLDPDYAQYEIFQKSGMLRVFTAREGERLVGYSLYFVSMAPHYKGSKQAVQDILFMDAEFRKGSNGIRFIRYCDDWLRTEGVQVTYQSTTMQGMDFGIVLERLGYRPLETLYARRLDQWEDR